MLVDEHMFITAMKSKAAVIMAGKEGLEEIMDICSDIWPMMPMAEYMTMRITGMKVSPKSSKAKPELESRFVHSLLYRDMIGLWAL